MWVSILIGVSPKARTWIVAGVLVLISILVGREVFLRLIAPAPPLNFDEAAHSLPGYYILRDILALDLRALWGDFHIQTLWPPGFSLLQAPFLGILGRNDESARLFAYIMLVATALVACAIAYQISPELAPLAGLVSGLIALSAPGWLFVGSWAMQETPVAFVVFVAFWCFLQALKTQRTIWFFLTGCALYFAFLTKFNYAAFAIAAVGIVDLGARLRLLRTLKNSEGAQTHPFSILNAQFSILALYAPLVAGILFWFFGGTDIVPTEVKWRDFRFFVTNEDSGYPFWSAENLLFYVRTMFDWLMPSPWLAVASLLGAAWAVVRIRHPGVTLLAIYFVLGFVLATMHQLKAERYITPLFPSLWLLTGLGAAELVKEIGDWRLAIARRGSHSPISNLQSLIPIFALFAIISWSWLTWLPRLQPVWAGHLADDLRAASHQIVRWQQADRPVLIIGTFGELSPPLFEWRLRPLPAFANTPHPIQYDAPPVEGPNDIARVQRWLDENPGAQVTLIRVDESSPLYQTDDMRNKNEWRQRIVRAFGEVRGYRLVDEVAYPNSGLTISYYLPG
ncbi:MAG: glycosyltransferase family 39 protein [Anaerolineae bacterium]|nr:glycosyltransferase family 39 protein [Candidatus Roseilinea sp.]MDW8451576.1 glycosyltransferase family 39 protein [Anaerolineae bacterium]